MAAQEFNDVVNCTGGLQIAGANIDNAWTPYTPTVGAVSGALTTASATGRYKLVGKTCFVQGSVTITTNGTGAGGVLAGLPFNSKASIPQLILARDAAGSMLVGFIGTGIPGSAQLYRYDAAYPGGDGKTLYFGGSYEVA